MQSHQRPSEVKSQLSNIIEERSEVHNISSIKSSKIIQDLKINTPLCFICGYTSEGVDNDKPLKHQNILIYPCFCNQMAHRDCMKKYIAQNKLTNCHVCKANYAVGKLSIRTLSRLNNLSIMHYFERFLLFLAFAILIGIFILFTAMSSSPTKPIATWKTIIIVLFSFGLGLMGIYTLLAIREELRGLKRLDIEIYCNQTEIAYHNKDSKNILKEFIENVEDDYMQSEHESGTGEEEDDEEEAERPKFTTRQGTNMSLLREKQLENIVYLEDKFQNGPRQVDSIQIVQELHPERERKNCDKLRKRDLPKMLSEVRQDTKLQVSPEDRNLSGMIGELSSIKPKKEEFVRSISANSGSQAKELKKKSKVAQERGMKPRVVISNSLEVTSINYEEEKEMKDPYDKDNLTVHEYVEEIEKQKKVNQNLRKAIFHPEEVMKRYPPEDPTIMLDFSKEIKQTDLPTNIEPRHLQKDHTLSLTF